MNLGTQTHTFHARIAYDWNIHNMFRHFCIFRIVNSTGLKWDKLAVLVDGKRNTDRSMVGKPQSKRPFGKARKRLEYEVYDCGGDREETLVSFFSTFLFFLSSIFSYRFLFLSFLFSRLYIYIYIYTHTHTTLVA